MTLTTKIINELRSMRNEHNIAGMKKFAIGNDNTLGISIPTLRQIAKQYKKNHELALALWQSHIHEAMLLAVFIADPKQVTPLLMDTWTRQFKSWDLCDQACGNLFHRTPFFIHKAFEYSYAQSEFVKRTGFVLMVAYTLHHKKADDNLCIDFLKRIEEEAYDERNFVKKAVNWCLRQIGKRNTYLHSLAIQTAIRIKNQNTPAARWISNNALRELHDPKIISRLKPQNV